MSRPDDGADADLVAVLVDTLEAHLAHGSDIGRTAEVLGIHRSIGRYRLYRTRELTGLDPEDPGALPSLHRLRDRAEPPERGRGRRPDSEDHDGGCGHENARCSS